MGTDSYASVYFGFVINGDDLLKIKIDEDAANKQPTKKQKLNNDGVANIVGSESDSDDESDCDEKYDHKAQTLIDNVFNETLILLKYEIINREEDEHVIFYCNKISTDNSFLYELFEWKDIEPPKDKVLALWGLMKLLGVSGEPKLIMQASID